MTVYELLRDVTQAECFWLNRDYKQGELVYLYSGYTYGCITQIGVACSEQPGQIPFFELPLAALKKIIKPIEENKTQIMEGHRS